MIVYSVEYQKNKLIVVMMDLLLALNEITGALTVLASSYQNVLLVVAPPCVKCALLNPSGDAAFINLTSYTS